MTRRPPGFRQLSVTVVLASALWLTGCANIQSIQIDAD